MEINMHKTLKIQVQVDIDVYHNPSTMSDTGLVNRGTIFDVVSDLKP